MTPPTRSLQVAKQKWIACCSAVVANYRQLLLCALHLSFLLLKIKIVRMTTSDLSYTTQRQMKASALAQWKSAERTAAPCGADDLFPKRPSGSDKNQLGCDKTPLWRTHSGDSQPASCPGSCAGSYEVAGSMSASNWIM